MVGTFSIVISRLLDVWSSDTEDDHAQTSSENQYPAQLQPEALSVRLNWPKRESDLSFPYSIQVKKAYVPQLPPQALPLFSQTQL
jgi:hypothetical protein